MSEQKESEGLLRPGSNCMSAHENTSAKVYVDGCSYFEAAHRCFTVAKESIWIAGWDINSQLVLIRGEATARKRESVTLNNVLYAAAERGVKVKILIWDFSSFFAMERELFSKLKFSMDNHPNIEFYYDGEHPITASQHQKLVIIDRQLAFCGGLDLTRDRWDTSDHRPDNPFRCNPSGSLYNPFHDVQVGLVGEAVESLVEVFSERWKRATGHAVESGDGALPNEKLKVLDLPDFKGVKSGIARTLPKYKTYPAITEVSELYKDSISATQDFLYIENQYFTSDEIAEEIEKLISRENPPIVVLILPKFNQGFFETQGLRLKQSEIIERLRNKDKKNRLFIFYPEQPGLSGDQYIKVHSKVMIGDNCWLRIGSSNLTKRSMSLDSEADVFFEASDKKTMNSITQIEARLLAEHSGLKQDKLKPLLQQARYDEIMALIEDRTNNRKLRRLCYLQAENRREPNPAVMELADAEKPSPLDEFVDEHIITRLQPERSKIQRHFVRVLIGAGIVFSLVLLWKFTPAAKIFDQEWLKQQVIALQSLEYGIAYTLLLFIGLCVAFVPLNLLILAVATIFEAPSAIFCIIAGSLVGACLAYAGGWMFGANSMQRLWPQAYEKLQHNLVTQSTTSIVLIRIIPIAPFNVINILSGALRVNFAKYALGTLIGVLPGTLTLVFFQKSLLSMVETPDLPHVLLFVITLACIMVVYKFAKKRLAS